MTDISPLSQSLTMEASRFDVSKARIFFNPMKIGGSGWF